MSDFNEPKAAFGFWIAVIAVLVGCVAALVAILGLTRELLVVLGTIGAVLLLQGILYLAANLPPSRKNR